MRRTPYHLLLFLSLLFIFAPGKIKAQTFASLPKITPSYSEDFSHYKSFPSLCFDDAFIDNNGKLWLTTCASISRNKIHLYQFDGYEFRQVKGELEQLDHLTSFTAMVGGNRLIGHSRSVDAPQLIVLDLQTDSLQFYPLPFEGGIEKIFCEEDGTVQVIQADKEQISFSQWSPDEYRSLEQMEMKDMTDGLKKSKRIPFYYFDGEIVWMPSFQEIGLQKIDAKQGVVFKKYLLSDFDAIYNPINPRGLAYTRLRGRLRVIKERTYFIDTYFYPQLEGKIFELDQESDRFIPISDIPSSWMAVELFEDEKGNLIFLYKDEHDKYQAILQDIDGKRYNYSAFFDLSEGGLAVKGRDFRQRMLICTASGIMLHVVKASGAIGNYLPGMSMRSMAELPDKRVAITGQRIKTRFLFEPKSSQITDFHIPDCVVSSYQLIPDATGNLWTYWKNDIICYNPQTNSCKSYSFPNNNIHLFTFIGKDRIAIINRKNKLFFFDLLSLKVEALQDENLTEGGFGFAQDILMGNDGTLWVASTEGLWKVNIGTKAVEIIGKSPPFEDYRMICLQEDEKGRLWIGTSIGGLHIYDPVSGKVKILNSDKGLANNTVVSITADNDGDRWVGTYNGISLISSEGDLILNLYEEDGLIYRECNRYSDLKTSDGKLYIGTVKGLNVIDPKKIKERLQRSNEMKIYLTELEYVQSTTDSVQIQQYGLNEVNSISLPASNRSLKVSFASSNYFKPNENKYAYQIEGLDNDWVSLGNQHTLNLANLPAGDYRLLVKGSDGVGNWTPEPLTLSIHAGEYFYKTIWFYLLCLLSLGLLSLAWIQRLRLAVKKATRKIREDKELIEKQAEKLKELDVAKSRFFTNISHEFRTPLTIITGMAGQIKGNPQLWAEKGAEMIRRNGANLLHLVNQILDLRKLESGTMAVQHIQGDVVQYLRYVTEAYESYAQSKGLMLRFETSQNELVMDFDPDKLLKVITNLLSNAVKHTPEGGRINFQIDQEIVHNKPWLKIYVEDSGTGIPEDQLPHIFERFYQAEGAPARKIEGTGIGLAYTRELIHLLKGRIEVSSTFGQGSIFVITLPITRQSAIQSVPFSPDLQQEEAAFPLQEESVVPHSEAEEKPVEVTTAAEQANLLIVEDNLDIQQFLIACLQQDYQLEMAIDGQEGIDKAIELIPDLIISDVMMPKKNGYELTDFLKTDERTSHIPIVLLTAKVDMDSKISGLEKGADDYLTKPFEPKELLLRLRNLLSLRQQMQKQYEKVSRNIQIATNPRALIKDPFLRRLYDLIEENLSDADYDMPRISRSLGVSRSQIFRKVKALTGKTPSAFIRSIRLQKGKYLLATTNLTVAEVAYEVGFTAPSYFSTTFFEEFGVRPTDIRK